MLTSFKSTGDKGLRWLNPAHQFNYDGNLFVFNNLIDIGHKVVVMASRLQALLFRIIANQDLGNLNVILSSLANLFMVFF